MRQGSGLDYSIRGMHISPLLLLFILPPPLYADGWRSTTKGEGNQTIIKLSKRELSGSGEEASENTGKWHQWWIQSRFDVGRGVIC